MKMMSELDHIVRPWRRKVDGMRWQSNALVFLGQGEGCCCQSQQEEAPLRKQTSVETEAALMEIKEKAKKKKSSAPQQGTTTLTPTNPHADTDGEPYHMRALFIKAKHKAGHTLRCEHSCVNRTQEPLLEVTDTKTSVNQPSTFTVPSVETSGCFSVMPHDPYLSVDPVFMQCFYLGFFVSNKRRRSVACKELHRGHDAWGKK